MSDRDNIYLWCRASCSGIVALCHTQALQVRGQGQCCDPLAWENGVCKERGQEGRGHKGGGLAATCSKGRCHRLGCKRRRQRVKRRNVPVIAGIMRKQQVLLEQTPWSIGKQQSSEAFNCFNPFLFEDH